MTKIVKFPGSKHEETRNVHQSRRASSDTNCSVESNDRARGRSSRTLSKSAPKEKLKVTPGAVTAEYWIHHKDNGTELRFAQQPEHVPALHVWSIRQYRKGQSEACGIIEYTATFNRFWVADDCASWDETPPRSPGWVRCKVVPAAIKERLIVDADRPSTVWVRK
jgi:hypothetical protein